MRPATWLIGFKSGSPPDGVGDGLIGDAHGLGGDEILGLLGIGGQVQIGVKDLVGLEHGALASLRLFDLNDHFSSVEDFGCVIGDLGAGAAIVVVGRADSTAGIGLDQHGMAMGRQFGDAFGRQTDAIFVILDFFGDTNAHDGLLAPRAFVRRK